jgi:hypothetical protein
MAVALTEQSAPELRDLLPLWHPSAPRSVWECSTTDGPFGNWSAWQKHLARRRGPTLPRFFRRNDPALLWGWPLNWQRGDLQALLASPTGIQTLGIRFSLPEFEFDHVAANVDLSQALQWVALAYGLPELASQLPADAWWKLIERLHLLATDSQQYRVDWPADPSDVVRQQLIAGELPLALGYLFPEIRAIRELRKGARAAFTEALIELTDGQGLPHARLLPVLGPLFACWTRARWLGSNLGRGPWSRKAEFQYQWLVRHALRLADEEGRFLLTPGDPSSPAWSPKLFATALELAGDSGDCAAAATALPRGAVPKRLRFKACDLPDPSLNSDWSGIAVLAGGWSQDDVRVAVAYADDPVRIELAVDGERMLFGPWLSETTCDGESVRVAGEWERLCWESGKRFDFLELGIELSHGLRLERQILLGRADAVLYLADIVVASDRTPRRLQHSIKLPLDDHDAWRPELETRDGLLLGHRARVAVLPLALREWRADPRSGELVDGGGHLTLTQEAHGRALCCPLFLDLNRKRVKKERTWRQLTIGESLEIVPHDAAVGFRAQSGPDQWIVYRSLGPAGNRTVLGQNIAGEFSAGPFLASGKYKEWIEIEAV